MTGELTNIFIVNIKEIKCNQGPPPLKQFVRDCLQRLI